MNEPQYKPITGMINVNDIQEILENNRYYQEEIERQKEIIKQLDIKNLELTIIIDEFDEWLKEKKEQMERFELYKRKETGAFWYSTMGNIEIFIEKIKEFKGVDKE